MPFESRSETVSRRAGRGKSARPDPWGARLGNRPGLPDLRGLGQVRVDASVLIEESAPRFIPVDQRVLFIREALSPQGCVLKIFEGGTHPRG